MNPAGGTDLRKVVYDYDGLNRMEDSTLTIGSNTPIPTQYDLDDSGNRTWVDLNNDGVVDSTEQYGTISPLHEYEDALPSDPFNSRVHDANGNWLGSGNGPNKLTMTYDSDNLMTTYDNADTSVEQAYHYDTANRRTWVDTDNDGTPDRFYLYLGDRILEEYDALGVLQSSFVYGNYVDEIIQREDANGDEYYFHQNDQWNVVALTDGAGVVQQRYLYDDFGTPTVANASWIAQPLETPLTTRLFQGREYDLATELYYYRARYYEPATGRFTTRDPLGIWGDLLHLGNGYTFLNSNPWSLIDPFGLEAGSNISSIWNVRWDPGVKRWRYRQISMDELAYEDRDEIAVNGMNNDLAKATGLMGDHFRDVEKDLGWKDWDEQFILFYNPTDGGKADFKESLRQKYGSRDQLTLEYVAFQQEVQRLNGSQGKESFVLGHSQGSLIVSQALEHQINNVGKYTLDSFTYRFHGAAANKWVTNRRIRLTCGNLAGGSSKLAWDGHPADPVHNWVGRNTLNPLRYGYSIYGAMFLNGKKGTSPHTRAYDGSIGLPDSTAYTKGRAETN